MSRRDRQIEALQVELEERVQERNQLQALLTAVLMKSGGEATVGNATLVAAMGDVYVNMQPHEDGGVVLRVLPLNEEEAS